jgi:hypothetical protein
VENKSGEEHESPGAFELALSQSFKSVNPSTGKGKPEHPFAVFSKLGLITKF